MGGMGTSGQNQNMGGMGTSALEMDEVETDVGGTDGNKRFENV